MTQSGKTVIRNSTIGLAAQMAIKVLSFAFSVLIIRRLGAYDFGLYSAIIAFTTAFAFIADLGLGSFTIRQVARYRDEEDGERKIVQIYGDVFWLRVVLSPFAILVFAIAAHVTKQPAYLIGAIILNSASLLLYALQGASDAILAGFERVDIGSKGKVIQQLIFVVLGGLALFLGAGYVGLVVASLLGVLALTVYCWQAVKVLGVHLGKPAVHNWLPLLKASLPFGIISLALGLSYKFDTILLTTYRHPDEVGMYNAAYNLVLSAVLVANVINTALYPTLSRQSVTDPAGLPRIYTRVMRYLMTLSMPIAVGGWVIAGDLIPLLYKQAFAAAVPSFQILVWVIPLMFASDFLGYVVIIGNHENVVARAVVVSTVLNIALNLLLVPRYGLIAASVMTVVTELVLVGQYIWYLTRLSGGLNWYESVIKPLVASVIMGFIMRLLHPNLGMFLSIAAGGLIYMVLVWVFGVIRKEDFAYLRRIRQGSPPQGKGEG